MLRMLMLQVVLCEAREILSNVGKSTRSVDGLAGGVNKIMLWSEQSCMRVPCLDKRGYSLLESITM